ncbi:MAG: trehalose-6-phosphate synthase, partial [Myxococcales bacterium]|nr:trehalose-6-phosphate synthase [Myxococcales bacterium]
MTFERASLGLFAAALLGVFGALGGAFVRAIDTGATPTGAVHAIESPRASVGAQAGAASVVSDLAHLAEDALVIASNRGPVNFAEGASGAIEVRRAGGGLATGLAPLVENRSNVTWIASAVDGVDLRAARTRVPTPGFNMRYVTMDPARYDLAYNHVANEALWFAAHGFWDGVRAPRFDATFRDAWKAFRELNRKFAGAIDRAAPEGGTVLVQDYHLPLVGDLL